MPEIASLFASAKEQTLPIDGRVKGVIPSWLEGMTLMRLGPGLFDIEDNFTVNHFLDGMAMLGKIEIKGQKATFCQKLLETEALHKCQIAKKPVMAEFGTPCSPDPTKNIFSRVFSTLVPTDLTDNNVVALYRIEDELIAASETCFVHSVDSDSLLKKERLDYMKTCGIMLMCAHPLTDDTGTTYNIGSSILTGLKYQILKTPAVGTGRALDALKDSKIIASISSSWKTCISYFHTFSITANYIVFIEQPLLINCIKMAQMGIKQKALKDCFEWTESVKNRFYIIEKETGNVLKTKFVTAECYFILHNINAYEIDDQIVIDIVTYPSPEILMEKLTLSNLRQNEFSSKDSSQVNRFVIPLITFVQDITEGDNLVTLSGTSATAIRLGDTIVLQLQPFAEQGIELPTINPRYSGKPYRYFYGSGMYDEGYYKNAIAKVDMFSGHMTLWKAGANSYCGEPTYIPKALAHGVSDSADLEDEGLIACCISCTQKSDYLVILDSKTFTEQARIEFDAKFAQALHANVIMPYR